MQNADINPVEKLESLKLQYAGGGKNKKDVKPFDPCLAPVASRLREISAARKELEREEAELQSVLLASIGDAYGISDVAVWYHQAGREYVDIELLRDELGEQASRYIKRSNGFRVLKLK